jgi:hypothetical protein
MLVQVMSEYDIFGQFTQVTRNYDRLGQVNQSQARLVKGRTVYDMLVSHVKPV